MEPEDSLPHSQALAPVLIRSQMNHKHATPVVRPSDKSFWLSRKIRKLAQNFNMDLPMYW